MLSRERREEILLNWGFSFEDIIDSIRGNIKIKNQRRQTVTNLGKVERIEEAFESASRKLKRALLLRRRTGDMVKELQDQADVAAKTLNSLRLAEEHALNKIHVNQAPEEVEPDGDELEKLVEVSVSDFCKKVPSESKLLRAASSMSSIELEESTCGFSLATSVSPSVLEMERFYQELELEMFGDRPLPDMVGETLEVPGLEIPEEERVYYDPPSVAKFREPPSVTPTYAQRIHENREYLKAGSRPTERHQVLPPSIHIPLQPKAMMISPKALESKEDTSDWRSRSPVSRVSLESEPGTPPFPHGPAPAGTCLYHNDPVMAIRMGQKIPQQVHASKSGEWKEVDRLKANMTRAYLSHTVTEMEQTYLHPSLAPPLPPPNQFGMTFIPVDGPSARFPRGPVPGYGGHSKLSSRRKDGPEVRHIPPFTNLSPTHWMEGRDSGTQAQRPKYEPITISEEPGYQLGRTSSIPRGLPPTKWRESPPQVSTSNSS